MLRRYFSIIVGFGLVCLCACSAKYKHQVNFNPNEPLRIAVLPFVQLDKHGAIIEKKDKLGIDQVAVVSSVEKDAPAELIRKLIYKKLSRSNLDLLSNYLVDVELPHNGFGRSDGSFNLEKIYNSKAKDFCKTFLDCDAVLFGRVIKWERNYYGIQSVNTVAVELKLVSAKDESLIFSANSEDSDSRGLTKGPTGLSSLILEPLKGLDSEIITELASRVVDKSVEPLLSVERMGFLDTAAPAIYATAHDHSSGRIRSNDSVLVLMYGTSQRYGSFSIGKSIENIPMLEMSPGHYVGEYYPLKDDKFSSESVYVQLMDRYGRVSTQKIDREQLSRVD